MTTTLLSGHRGALTPCWSSPGGEVLLSLSGRFSFDPGYRRRRTTRSARAITLTPKSPLRLPSPSELAAIDLRRNGSGGSAKVGPSLAATDTLCRHDESGGEFRGFCPGSGRVASPVRQPSADARRQKSSAFFSSPPSCQLALWHTIDLLPPSRVDESPERPPGRTSALHATSRRILGCH